MPTIDVPDDEATIQEAVDAAGQGDTISVAAGTYGERVVVDTSALTIQGPNATHGDSTTRGDEATVGQSDGAFVLDADEITVDGFEITNATAAYSDNNRGAITTAGDASGYTIRNNVIRDNDLGILLRGDGSRSITVADNLVTDNTQASDGIARGLGTGWWDPTSDVLKNATIENNTFTGHVDGSSSFAIQLAAVGSHEDVTVGGTSNSAGNTFEGSVVVNQTDGYEHLHNDHDMSADADSDSILYFGGDVDNIKIEDNAFENAGNRAIGVFRTFAGPNGSFLTFKNNEFGTNELQVEDGGGDIDNLADVVDNNDFDQAITVRDSSDIVVATIFSNISDAVDAASSSERVVVEPGEYAESTTISLDVDDLTLEGPYNGTSADDASRPGDEAEILDPVAITGKSNTVSVNGLTIDTGDEDGIDIGVDSHGVSIRNNIVDGSGDPTDAHVGVRGRGNSATVTDNKINGFATGIRVDGSSADIRDNVIPANGTTLGIKVTDSHGTVAGNELHAVAGDGIDVYGDNHTVENNDLNDIDDVGIQIDGSPSNPTHSGGTATDNTLDTIGKAGIKIDQSAGTATDNDLTNVNQTGIEVLGDSATVTENVLDGIGAHGLEVVGDDSTIEDNDLTNVTGRSVDAAGDDAIIQNNTIVSSGDGISLKGDTGDIDQNDVRGSGLGEGIAITGDNNEVTNNDIADASDGIRIDGADNEIKENEVSTNSTVGIELQDHASGSDIRHNTISGNGSGDGILIHDIGSANEVVFNTVENHGVTVRVAGGGNPAGVRVSFNDLLDSDDGAIVADAPSGPVLDARSNYWDHKSGPSSFLGRPDRSRDPDTNQLATGEGLSVSRNVRFDAWLDLANAFILDGSRDLDGDGRHEDVDGDGTHWPTDGHFFLRQYRQGHYDRLKDVGGSYISRFDYDGDGEVTREDVARMVLQPHE